MGRLDDAAKRKVVELREAGLSFRKIKAVLELENIKVSAQAIYLFLKEFNGRNGTNLAAGGAGVQANMGESSTGSRNNSWRDQLQLGTLMREASRVAGYSTSPDPPQQGGSSSEDRGILYSTGATSGASRGGVKEVRKEDEEEDIRIVSVTSLAQRSPQDGVHSQRTSMTTGVGAMTGIFARRRLTLSPSTNPVLLARKRLLDKALLHRARVRDGGLSPGQQVATPTRRDQSWRNMMLPQPASSIDLTTTRPQQVRRIVDGHPDVRRGFQPRIGVPTPPRVGVRLPSPAAPNTTTQASVANPGVRIQHPANQPQRREPSPNYQPGVMEALRQGLGEQVQGLGSEVRSLGLAVRMLVEQQSRLEREQVQQTQVQKQILSTLQFLASRPTPGPCALTHPPTPTPPSPVSLVAVSSYGQSNFTSTQSSYTQGSLALSESSVLENAEAFSLSGMSSAGMNGFSVSESLQPAHTHTSPSYSQSLTHTHTPLNFTQTPVTSHTQTHSPILHQNQGLSHTDSFEDSKDTEFPDGRVDRNLQDYSSSIPGISPLSLSPQEPQLNIIKVETD